MKIPEINSLPGATSRAKWARILEINQSTLWRAEQRGLLEGLRTKSGGVIYTKEAILEWVGMAQKA
jgi:predicted site-specific integrase-resolvase